MYGDMNGSNQRNFTQLKKLGVLGGMGPAASAEFLRILAEEAPAETDQEHPIVYLISDSQVPDRSSAILGKGNDPTERLKADLLSLVQMGADLLAVPCNTAHYFIDQFRSELPVPLVHIVEETVLAAQRLNPEGCWMLSTVGTRQSGLYQKYAQGIGYQLWLPDSGTAARVQESINLVKAGKQTEAGALIRAVVLGLWRERDVPVMAACTELPLAYDASGLPPERTVSSLGALVDACLHRIYSGV
ncbi:MAG: amino acid racemase [Veillonellales bacterium]